MPRTQVAPTVHLIRPLSALMDDSLFTAVSQPTLLQPLSSFRTCTYSIVLRVQTACSQAQHLAGVGVPGSPNRLSMGTAGLQFSKPPASVSLVATSTVRRMSFWNRWLHG